MYIHQEKVTQICTNLVIFGGNFDHKMFLKGIKKKKNKKMTTHYARFYIDILEQRYSVIRVLSFSSKWGGGGGGGGRSQIYRGSIFWKEKWGGVKIFDDQNVGSHKMITDSVFILFKETDFNTTLACLRGKVYQ